MSIKERYLEIRHALNQVAIECGRNPQEITLLAVSKGHPSYEIDAVYEVGCRDFGESRVQEALKKMETLPANIHWHLIGTLQKNKVNQVIGKFKLIHSIDSFELACALSAASSKAQAITSILLQVNTSGESTKHGLSALEWQRKLDELLELPGLSIEGLMTMAPLTDDESIIRRCFADLRQCRDQFAIPKIRHLSMGMSHDWPIAIAEGATIVRIGTSIFTQ